MYTWQESDRIELVAYRFFKTPAVWWKIMDYNPEIGNPFDIPVGTVLRIPNVR
jgi:nucleoid-associated protein YgaU